MEPQASEDILGAKKKNYEFLQLVRDKKYGQAYLIGRQILKADPNHPSIAKFMVFIEKNAKQLDEMVKDEEEYESAHSSDDSEEEGQAQSVSSSGQEIAQGQQEQEDEEATKPEEPQVVQKKEQSSSEDSDDDSKAQEEQQEEEQQQKEEPKPVNKVQLLTNALTQVLQVPAQQPRFFVGAKNQGKA